MLQDIIKNSSSDAKSREAAAMRLVDITAAMEKELKAENLIKAEGYQECVIMFQADSTTIVLQSPPMQAQQIKRVKELVGQVVNSSPDKLALVTRGRPQARLVYPGQVDPSTNLWKQFSTLVYTAIILK